MMQLDPSASAAGVRLIAYEHLGSTNTEALALARSGERGPLWISATRQSAGRGRRGRTWVSEPGNLFASLLLTDPAPAQHWPELSFVAGLAIHDAVVEIAPSIRPQLAIKWPNDLLIAGAKFAGILTEAEAPAIAIGIGVNCTTHPADTGYPATDLLAAGVGISAGALFRALSATMMRRLAQWYRGEHFAAIRTDWLSRAANLGSMIRVRLSDREITGCFETLDNVGRLVLVAPDGSRQVIAAGDVVQLIGSDRLQRQPDGGER